jgi:molybdopterin/thiamine biosynthesis adenylyltransferase/proteasome lid subunit RPN8/RPN11
VTRYTLTLLEEHRAAIQRSLLRDGSERAAILLCGRSRHVDPWTGILEERFLGRSVIEVPDAAYVERSPTHLTWSTTPFYNAIKQAEGKGHAIAVFHSHPNGPLAFSPRDDIAEKELFEIAYNASEHDRPHLSVIMDGRGEVRARAYESELEPHDIDLIRVIGERWQITYKDRGQGLIAEEFDRQVRAFGGLATQDLGNLRIGIVGSGGHGSAVATLLPRIGVRHLALFDRDYVDESNLNRLHFSTRVDANLHTPKVDVVGQGVAEIGLAVSVVRFHRPVDEEPFDAIRSCDVIFGCTDDNLGRNFLNRLAHFYLIPVIDLGLLIEPNEHAGYDSFDGRVTVVQPGYPCQVCRGLIDSEEMHSEALQRHDPVLYREYRRAGYIVGGTDPAPVVISFTTEVAAMAVNELFHRLTGFRGPDGSCGERVRDFREIKDSDTIPAGRVRSGCKLCDTRKYDGRGDMEPFLDQA